MRSLTVVMCLAFATLAQASEFSTFIGDSSDYQVARILAGASGDTYIGGSRTLSGGISEVFVMKLDSAGNIVLFNILSGKGNDIVNDVAMDGAGNLYVAGATTSLDLPLHNPLQSVPGPGFLAKFSPDLSQVTYSTYFPAPVQALAADSSSNVYLTGSTTLPTFPVTPGLPAGPVTSLVSGAFLTKLSAAGDRIVYSTVVSGFAKDCGCCSGCLFATRNTAGVSIAVDPAGEAYMAGNTDTSDIPTTSGALLRSGTGAFVAKMNAAGSALAYLTYIGATHYAYTGVIHPADTAASIAVDAAGNAYLAGATTDPQFPATAGAYQTAYGSTAPQSASPLPPSNAFLAKLNPTGSGVVWATYLGGAGPDAANAVALDSSGGVWIAGQTSSANFPNTQGWSNGGDFIVELDPAGSKLPYAARYPNGAARQTLAPDSAGVIHFAGPAGLVSTMIPSGPPLMRIFGVGNSAYGDIGGRAAYGELISIYGPHIGPATAVTAVPDQAGVLPTAVPGLQVLGPLPLLYASDAQINAVFTTQSTQLRIVNGSATSPAFPVTAVAALPEIFQNADGSALALNQDLTPNSSAHPAPVGSVVSIWVTGVSAALVNPAMIATAPYDSYCCTVSVAGQQAGILYSGVTPRAAGGVQQINFQIPSLASLLQSGPTRIVVGAEGVPSHPATLYVSK